MNTTFVTLKKLIFLFYIKLEQPELNFILKLVLTSIRNF